MFVHHHLQQHASSVMQLSNPLHAPEQRDVTQALIRISVTCYAVCLLLAAALEEAAQHVWRHVW